MIHHTLRTALVLAGSYVFFCSLYIWFSGIIALKMAHSLPNLQNIELYKGLAFVIVTGIIIFSVTYFLLQRIRKQQYELNLQRKVLLESQARVLAGTFASGIAHDINNVLGAIDFGLSEIESVVSEDKKEHVKSIYKSYEMIHEMALRLQKIGKTQIETEMKTINVGEFISQTIEFARRHRKLKLCDVRMKKVGTSILSVNPFLFEQMLINLMLNAADATEQQGIIELNVENREDQIAIEVHDNGPGISEENKERIFQPFHTTKTDGTGLGLTTVQLCAELHNGSIDIEKSPLGGALFKITFPQIPIRKSDSKN